MTPEQLMNPRYEVIADYPFSCLRIGFIISEPVPITNPQALQQGVSDFDFISRYPHIFRKLEWWEKRGMADLPEYLITGFGYKNHYHNERAIVFKIDGYIVSSYHGYIFPRKEVASHDPINWFLPATEQDYIKYKKNK